MLTAHKGTIYGHLGSPEGQIKIKQLQRSQLGWRFSRDCTDPAEVTFAIKKSTITL